MATGKLRIKGVNTSRPQIFPEFNILADFGSRETSRDLNKDGILVPYNWSIVIDQITDFDVNTFTYSLGTNIVNFEDTTDHLEYSIDTSSFVLNEYYKFNVTLQNDPLNFKALIDNGRRIDGIVFKYLGITNVKGIDYLEFSWFMYDELETEMWIEQVAKGTLLTSNTSTFTTF